MLGGVGSVVPLNYCTYTDLENRICYFCIFDVLLVSRGLSFRTYFIFTAADVVPCGAEKRRSADNIFSDPLGSLGTF